MRLVIIESPLAASTHLTQEQNVVYAKLALFDSILRGEAPLASHLLYPLVLDDTVPSERDIGKHMGWEWFRAATLIAFYTDLGMSPGMTEALDHVIKHHLKHEFRRIECLQLTQPISAA